MAALREVHEADGYPSRWPDDPAGWLTPDGSLGSWVAEHDGAIVGGVGLVSGPAADEIAAATGVPGLAAVVRLYVAPRGRGAGSAAELVRAAVAAAQRRGVRAGLEVRADTPPAIALYRKLGWTLAGTGRATWQDRAGVHPALEYYLAPNPPRPTGR